jgi:predicted metalloprotease with PDZ domain
MVRYRLEVHDLHAHLFRVTLTVPNPLAVQRLSLPVWIPGSYLIREFSRHISALQAQQGSRGVALTQIDKCTWQVACSGRTALTVSYLVYAFDASVRTAWLDSQRGFFNGTSVFLRCEGREHDEHRVTLAGLPRDWQVATAMAARGANEFSAGCYDELIDHPFELGDFWRGEFAACGVAHSFVVSGALPSFDGERLLADAQRICETQLRFWHGENLAPHTVPFAHYVFLLNAVDDNYGGLEHRASTALIAGRRDLPRQGVSTRSEGYVTLLGLISHEYFHTWNVKRLKPRDFAPYDLTRENYTQLLWFFEGFTSYYDDLLLLRAGLIDEPRYLKLLSKTATQVAGTPGRALQSVAQASFDAWVKYYRPDENTANATVSYYTKGALVALALDLRLRSEGRGTLDDVMRRLWAMSEGGAITEADIAAALAQVGHRAFGDELAAWVHGTGDLPLVDLLAASGVRWAREAATLMQRLGARVAEQVGSLKVQAVFRGSAAEQAGLAAGDEILAIDGWRLAKLDDATALQALDKPLPLLASRDRRVLTLSLPAAKAEGAVSLTLDPKPAAAVARRRAAWLASGKA